MPIRRLDTPAEPDVTALPDVSAPTGGIRRLSAPAPVEAAADDSWLPSGSGAAAGALAGAAALAGAGYLSHNANTPAVLKKGLEYANAARQQLMLSGFAPLKSFLGNVGAAVAASAEGRSLTPLKEFLSMDTVNDAMKAWRAGGSTINPPQGVTIPILSTPGRIMGSIDEATQKAMVRAGMTPDEAARSVFQTPLGENYGPLSDRFKDNPVADYLFPFRRTPLNQFSEGLETLKANDPLVLGAYAGAGAAHGALTKDDKYPLSIPLAISGAAKYGLPYGLAAIGGRLLAGGKGAGNSAGSVLPVSEYGLGQSVTDPTGPFTKPAALTALQKLLGQ